MRKGPEPEKRPAGPGPLEPKPPEILRKIAWLGIHGRKYWKIELVAAVILIAGFLLLRLVPLVGRTSPTDKDSDSSRELVDEPPGRTPPARRADAQARLEAKLARLKDLSAVEVLSIAYTGQPPQPAALVGRPTLQVEIFARRKGEAGFRSLQNGNALSSEEDDYLIVVRALSDGYLYVFQVDSNGKKDWLFPENAQSPYSSGANPVKSGEIVQIPPGESDRVLYLDHTTGIEHMYVVFLASRWAKLEVALSQPSRIPLRSGQSEPGGKAGLVQEPNGLLLRGVGGQRPAPTGISIERVHHGQKVRLPLTGKPLGATSHFLVVERWFRHVQPD